GGGLVGRGFLREGRHRTLELLAVDDGRGDDAGDADRGPAFVHERHLHGVGLAGLRDLRSELEPDLAGKLGGRGALLDVDPGRVLEANGDPRLLALGARRGRRAGLEGPPPDAGGTPRRAGGRSLRDGLCGNGSSLAGEGGVVAGVDLQDFVVEGDRAIVVLRGELLVRLRQIAAHLGGRLRLLAVRFAGLVRGRGARLRIPDLFDEVGGPRVPGREPARGFGLAQGRRVVPLPERRLGRLQTRRGLLSAERALRHVPGRAVAGVFPECILGELQRAVIVVGREGVLRALHRRRPLRARVDGERRRRGRSRRERGRGRGGFGQGRGRRLRRGVHDRRGRRRRRGLAPWAVSGTAPDPEARAQHARAGPGGAGPRTA